MSQIPLLSPKALGDYSPEDWKAYVLSLYQEPVRAVPKEFSASVNKKGTLVLRITREPKFLWTTDVDKIALDLGWKKQEAWLAVRKKKIEIRRPHVPGNKTRSNSSGPAVRSGPAKK